MEETGLDLGSYPIPPASVHLSPFSLTPPPSARLHSRHFTPPTHPLQSPSPPFSYFSLHGLLLNPDESRSIGGGLTRDETFAWELFTPYQRFLIVSVIGVAAAESRKNNVIQQLRKSVDLRDLVLSRMQQKLDDLCQQLDLVQDHSRAGSKTLLPDDELRAKFGSEKIKFVDCGCWQCDQHHHHHSSSAIHDKAPAMTDAEPEERRMSDMSDWCSSVTSAAEIHFDNLSLDQDMLSLRKECQEKDATIKDLTLFLQSTNKAGSKRETELEEIIRRKKTVIKKLKRDVMVLEAKVTQLTRLRRSSYSAVISPSTRDFPMRLDNLLYDMDVSTFSSSSDSDTPADTPRRAVLDETPFDSVKEEEPSALKQTHKSAPVKSSASLLKSVVNRKPVSVSASSRMRQASSTSDSKKPKRQTQNVARDSSGSHKRWV